MPNSPGDSVLGGPVSQPTVLDNRVRVPPWRTGLVSRQRLIDAAKASRARVVSVAAPAGYGKSTMLAEWASTETRVVAWASLERTDDDPAAFLPVLAEASSSLSPAVAEVSADMRGIGATALGRSAPLLAAALASATSSFVLFVDDLHWANSAACQDALEVLLASVPEGSQVVLAGRSESGLIARLRALGDTWEVTAEDLRLSALDARAIFDQAGAIDIADDELAAVVDRCEGWATGLFLCALIERSGGDAGAITGDDRYLSDYLYRECVQRLPNGLQRFLRRSAVFEQFSPAACNEVLDITDARARLRELEAANLFLIPLDRARHLFRYHALFREFLLDELERAEGAEAVAVLHERAADWYEANGAPERAVEHLLAARDVQRAADLVAELGLPMYGQGQVMTVRRWLHELGEPVLRSNPALVVSMTWTALLLGEVALGERWAGILNGIDPHALPASERVPFESARAMVRGAMCEHGVAQLVADATFATEHEPPSSPWRDQALHLAGSAALLGGDPASAARAFQEAVELARAMGNPDTVILSEPELALLAIDQGRWVTAGEHAAAGVAMIDENHMDGYPTTALALAVAARVAVRRGDRGDGERLLARGMRARVGCTHLLPFLSVRVRLQLAKAHVALGDRSAAWHLLHETEDVVGRHPDLGTLVEQLAEFRSALAADPAVGGSVPLTPAELRLLPYLQTHLTIGEIGQRLYVSRNTVSSQVGSIYRKLAVTTRSGAVERATALGLLGR